MYIKDQTSGKTVANTTGLWESVDLSELFTPEEDHQYVVSLLVEEATYSVSITKNTEFIAATGIGEDGTVAAGQEYTLPVSDSVVLTGVDGYRISKVFVKDQTSGKTVVNATGCGSRLTCPSCLRRKEAMPMPFPCWCRSRPMR